MAPFAELRPSVRARLEQTMASWFLHPGRRGEVAADLVVHPQTVRYRMGQVRELFGDRLRDPTTVFVLVVALGPAMPRPDAARRGPARPRLLAPGPSAAREFASDSIQPN